MPMAVKFSIVLRHLKQSNFVQSEDLEDDRTTGPILPIQHSGK